MLPELVGRRVRLRQREDVVLPGRALLGDMVSVQFKYEGNIRFTDAAFPGGWYGPWQAQGVHSLCACRFSMVV